MADRYELIAYNKIMRLFTSVSSQLRQFISEPSAQLGKGKRSLLFFATLAWLCARKLKRDNATQMAAALTYRTMFSLLPMVVLALIVLQAFRGMEEYQVQFKQSVIKFLLPEELLNRDTQTGEFLPNAKTKASIEVPVSEETGWPLFEEENTTATAKGMAGGMAGGGGASGGTVADARGLLGDSIQKILDNLEQVDFGKIGWAGLLLFIYGATTLLETIEKSFNSIFDVNQGRPWYLRLTFYYTVVTLGPLIIIAGQVSQRQLVGTIESGAWTNWLAGPLSVLTPVLTTWLVLLAMFVLLPHAKVRWHSAALGSFVAAALWVISKELFAIYATRTAVTSLYGALALVPLFLLWVYITWVIILFGLELAYTLQSMKTRRSHRETRSSKPRELCDTSTLIGLMAVVGEAFGKGNLIEAEQVTEQLNLQPHASKILLDKLESQGWLQRVSERQDGQSGLTLAKPPQQIALSELLKLGRSLTALPQQDDTGKPGGPGEPGGTLPLPGAGGICLANLYNAQQQAVANQTLADVLSPGSS